MPPTTGHKRRRIEQDDTPLAWSTVERDGGDIRKSLKNLHDLLPTQGDITVSVQGETGTSEFPCIGALLASASRPLAAMLFGPMRPASVGPDAPRRERILHLRGTEPWCFDLMLQFIHGRQIGLDVDRAVRLHHVADYYEVLPLRDSCCRFLLDALRPHNCCSLLMRSHDINCEPLTQRCIDTLTLDFVAVVESDSGFPDLNPAMVQSLLQGDWLVCAEEFEVYGALLKWYGQQPTAEKLGALLELLPLVRWAFIPEARRAEASLAVKALPPPPLSTEEAPSTGGAKPADAAEASQELSVKELERCVEQLLAQHPPAAEGEPPAKHHPRHYTWGTLVGRNPEPPAAPQLPEGGDTWRLECTKEYMIGRSRKSTIRIGHNAPMPYISSQHFRVFNEIRWPDAATAAAESPGASFSMSSPASPIGAPGAPRLEAWLEDLSQNGTFINGNLVGRNEKRRLHDGDRIELVFPQESAPRSPNNANNFPIFTFNSPLPDELPPPSSAERFASDTKPATPSREGTNEPTLSYAEHEAIIAEAHALLGAQETQELQDETQEQPFEDEGDESL
tara:strand:+ start:119 stop:1810 length:1692 start_codon:yes stop_codon:yes gene_type:complete